MLTFSLLVLSGLGAVVYGAQVGDQEAGQASAQKKASSELSSAARLLAARLPADRHAISRRRSPSSGSSPSRQHAVSPLPRMTKKTRSNRHKRQGLGGIESLVDQVATTALSDSPSSDTSSPVSASRVDDALSFATDALAAPSSPTSATVLSSASPSFESSDPADPSSVSSRRGLLTSYASGHALATAPSSYPQGGSASVSASQNGGEAPAFSTQIASEASEVVSTGLLTAAAATAAQDQEASPSGASEAGANVAVSSASSRDEGEDGASSEVQTNARGATVTHFSTAPAAKVTGVAVSSEHGADESSGGESTGRASVLAAVAVSAMCTLVV
ncbi:hypothetical protein JCM11641_004671 [Rhodosporidiobolus odoratus]